MDKAIQSYDFGRIVINNKEYTSDLIFSEKKICDSWWRKEGHQLCYEDLKEAIKLKPTILIIGTGAYGLMKVAPELVKYLEEKNIQVIIKKTKEACNEYNKLYRLENVVAAFHLTC